MYDRIAAAPLMWNRPRLRFIDGAPDGAAPAGEKQQEEKPAATEGTDHAAEIEKWKSLSRKNEQRAKDNESAAKKLADMENANKTELEKVQARAEAAEKALADRDAKDEATKLTGDVAKEKKLADRGIPADALRGSTREELEAHADQLLALVPEKPKGPSADGQGDVGDRIGDGDMSADDVVKEATGR